MAVLRSFFSMFIVLGMYYFYTEMDKRGRSQFMFTRVTFFNVYKVENVNGGK